MVGHDLMTKHTYLSPFFGLDVRDLQPLLRHELTKLGQYNLRMTKVTVQFAKHALAIMGDNGNMINATAAIVVPRLTRPM